MSDERSHDALTALLQAGDPAAGDPGLGSRERALMRQRILAAGSARRRRVAGWLVPAAAALALLALALGLAHLQPRAPLPPPGVGATQTASAAGAGRQLQFTTDNGTLVVWVLQPRSTG